MVPCHCLWWWCDASLPSPHMYHAHGLATFSMVPPPLPWCGPMHAWLPWFIMPEPCLQTESLYTFSCQVACCTLSPSSAKYASLRRLKPHETPKLKQRAALPPWSNSFTQRLNMFIHMQDPKPWRGADRTQSEGKSASNVSLVARIPQMLRVFAERRSGSYWQQALH